MQPLKIDSSDNTLSADQETLFLYTTFVYTLMSTQPPSQNLHKYKIFHNHLVKYFFNTNMIKLYKIGIKQALTLVFIINLVRCILNKKI